VAATEKKINYFARNFLDVRTELVNLIKRYYPNLYSDFNDASIGSMLIDLNAAVSDMLSHHTDRVFQETQLEFAQERKSLLNMARTLGLKIPGKRPSVTLVDFAVTVPVRGDTFDIRYAPKLRYGAQVSGGGQLFETLEDVDFASPFSSGGIPNRLILPNIDSNGTLQNYTLVKREFVVSGVSKIFKKIITEQDSKPFLEIVLPETNVLSIEQIISLEGTNLISTPTLEDFSNKDITWYEMDSLAEDKIFLKDDGRTSDNNGIVPGKWVQTNRRFIKDYTDKGFCRLTFGSGTSDSDLLKQFGENQFTLKIGDFINSTALGEIPKVATTMFIRYRVGGGARGNLGANSINSVGLFDMFLTGPNPTINQSVRRSLRVNNPIPSFGGTDEPSNEMIRQMIRYNFASQNRAVTIKDYVSIIDKMPGKFGVPFRQNISEKQNKIELAILGVDANNKLTNSLSNTLKENIASYLSDYRMINDYVLIKDGRIFDLGFEIDVIVEKAFSQGEIVNNIINKVKNYFDINKWTMGENIYLSNLMEEINNVGGVLNVSDVRVFNLAGGRYSFNVTQQSFLNNETRQIDLTEDFVLFSEYDSMFQVRFPELDIKVRVKN
jgi:hypothetical protein